MTARSIRLSCAARSCWKAACDGEATASGVAEPLAGRPVQLASTLAEMVRRMAADAVGEPGDVGDHGDR